MNKNINIEQCKRLWLWYQMWKAMCMMVCLDTNVLLSCHKGYFWENSTRTLWNKWFVISASSVTLFSLAYMSETAAATRLTCSKALNSGWWIHLEAHTTSFYPSVFVLLCEKLKILEAWSMLSQAQPNLPLLPQPVKFILANKITFHTLLVMAGEAQIDLA